MNLVKVVRIMALCVLSSLVMIGVSLAADLSQAKDTVDKIRLADPPHEVAPSSTTVPSATLERSTTTVPSEVRKEPPSPIDSKNNPTNDPDVRRGFEEHQKAHGKPVN